MPVISIFLCLFLIGDLVMLYLLYRLEGHHDYPLILLSLLALVLGYIVYRINFVSDLSEELLISPKDTITYTNTSFVIEQPLEELSLLITWHTVEAIFLYGRTPLEGQHQYLEYSIFLNTPARVQLYKEQSWTNKLSSLLRRPNSMIRIDDHKNKDFYTFNEAVSIYLSHSNPQKKSIGHQIVHGGAALEVKPSTMPRCYKIFDRNNPSDHEALVRFRLEAIADI